MAGRKLDVLERGASRRLAANRRRSDAENRRSSLRRLDQSRLAGFTCLRSRKPISPPCRARRRNSAPKYDPVSKRFYILDNPVLPAHYGRTTRALARTTAAMLSSKDLHHWNVEKIFLFTPNIDDGTWGEAFQYFNFDFDGDDLVLVSRTSFLVGDYKPPRGHDSNLLTFHRIKNFRTASPEHFFTIDADRGRVLRFESTQHADAPLGEFALGRRFDGKPLAQPTGLAQDANGDVYIGERSGRVLRFDAFGNYLGAVESSPVPLRQGRLSLAPPPTGECVWVRSDSNDWDDPMNWFYWRRPDAPGLHCLVRQRGRRRRDHPAEAGVYDRRPSFPQRGEIHDRRPRPALSRIRRRKKHRRCAARRPRNPRSGNAPQRRGNPGGKRRLHAVFVETRSQRQSGFLFAGRAKLESASRSRCTAAFSRSTDLLRSFFPPRPSLFWTAFCNFHPAKGRVVRRTEISSARRTRLPSIQVFPRSPVAFA